MKNKTGRGQIIFALAAAFLFSGSANVFGIVSWARKYDVDCVTCHAPAVPRLNALGHQFRKMGYRMETEVGEAGKPEQYKEIGEWLSVRFRTGYAVEHFSDTQPANNRANKFRTRNGFLRPDVTFFYAGALTKNLSLFAEVEVADVDETEVQVFGEWFNGTPERFWTIRMGQMHTLSRIGWGGFDRPTGITTPDVLSAKLTTSPVPFRVNQDQRGLDFAYSFTDEARLILGVYNGINQQGGGNEFNGAGFGDSDNVKDVLVAYEQMLGESGFTLFGYYGTWDQQADPANPDPTKILPDDSDFTEFNFIRLGGTASWVFNIFDPDKVGASELQGGYMYARDFYPKSYPLGLNPGDDDRDGHAFWLGAEQRLPHNAAVFYRYDLLRRSGEAGGIRQRHTLGAVYTIHEYLRLAAEGFVYDQNSDSYGLLLQAMLNY